MNVFKFYCLPSPSALVCVLARFVPWFIYASFRLICSYFASGFYIKWNIDTMQMFYFAVDSERVTASIGTNSKQCSSRVYFTVRCATSESCSW